MRKKFALLFVTVCAVMLSGCTLTGMTDVEKMYDDTERVTSGHTAYVATDWAEDSSVQGASTAFVAGGEGFIGAKKAFSFTVSDENSEIEILEKFQCDEGECKLLFVNTDTETVEVEYTADACEKLNLPKGEYQVYFVGKDLASFQANINLYSHSGDPNWQVDEGKEGALNPTR